ncbi:MAG TPA: DUF4242 domain-containing protein [Nitrospiria bacterium]|nr:DUF4242 domain-containing protein [Nitrospiria bacterium]
MPRFLIERKVGKLTEAQIDAGLRQAMKVADELHVKWIRTYYAADEGKMYCEYEAPTIDLIYEHARRAQVPADVVRMVTELQPAMFR